MTITETLATIREQVARGEFKEKPYTVRFDRGPVYWPSHPSASNHPIDDYKWAERDHPKD